MHCYLNRWYAAIFYIIAGAIILLTHSCAHAIPFQVDIGLSSSGEINAYEHTVVVQGKPCAGACIVQHVKNVNLSIVHFPRDYSYTLDFKCSGNINLKQDIEAKKQFVINLSPETLGKQDELNCIGIVSPHNRPEPITSKYRLVILLINPKNEQDEPYSKREDIYFDGTKIILGRYALYTHALTDTNQHIKLNKQTTMPWPQGAKSLCVETESHKMRYNFKCFP